MTVAYEQAHRGWSSGHQSALSLEDKFEVVKEIGDGSFGSVALARVRSAGAHVARRSTYVAIKTMKKSFESFAQCLELREVIFLRTLPNHPHLVPALDIFLDPYSKKLHIAMEYMDGNLYQLMKSRDHKHLEASNVKSILFQILSGLEHVHEHNFFHRDIKPENILVSNTSVQDPKRSSPMVTPPSTPGTYSIKIADFGLARETQSKQPYTTYVSTRWYRAPEVLLRAGEYSAPVDIWAVGAMAVEVATLKPLFPGSNEVDQVWRVCEIMGSPGNWVSKNNTRVGGGEWKEGIKLAQKLGFTFPKMAPHSLDTILQQPQWPASLSQFVTWCLMWDPKHRPTSTQALAHEYFNDATDPLRPKSSASHLLTRKPVSSHSKDISEPASAVSSKTSSWFRRSLGREAAAAVVSQPAVATIQTVTPGPSPVHRTVIEPVESQTSRPAVPKRATWANPLPNGAPMPILPSIRPVSPLSNTITAQASGRAEAQEPAKKIGRQLSVASHGNHYADIHRQEAERALNGQNGPTSPPSGQKESFFSHLRKRARRFSGRYQTPMSPNADNVEANTGCAPWASNRSSMILDQVIPQLPEKTDFAELDKVLQSVRCSLEAPAANQSHLNRSNSQRTASHPLLKRNHSLPRGDELRSPDSETVPGAGPISSRTRRALQKSTNPSHRYETPDEEDELLDEAISTAHKAARGLDSDLSATPRMNPEPVKPTQYSIRNTVPYLTPSPSANQNMSFGQSSYTTPSKPVDIAKPHPGRDEYISKWPTPPYEENEWAAAAAASIFAAQAAYS